MLTPMDDAVGAEFSVSVVTVDFLHPAVAIVMSANRLSVAKRSERRKGRVMKVIPRWRWQMWLETGYLEAM